VANAIRAAYGIEGNYSDEYVIQNQERFYKEAAWRKEKEKEIFESNIHVIAAERGITVEHAKIVYYSQRWSEHATVEWTTWDIAVWKVPLFGNSEHVWDKKKEFVGNYSDVMYDAAQKYDIPIFLLAGVSYSEFGGDPTWLDSLAYSVRSFDWSGPDWVDENLTITKNPNYTSFGNTSIQVRRALEMLEYSSATSSQKDNVIDSLKNPIEDIYMTAKHLAVLKDVDFMGRHAEQLTDNEIQIIASRYNVGSDVPQHIAASVGYGQIIFDRKEDIWEALNR
jgi:hypothetical protein